MSDPEPMRILVELHMPPEALDAYAKLAAASKTTWPPLPAPLTEHPPLVVVAFDRNEAAQFAASMGLADDAYVYARSAHAVHELRNPRVVWVGRWADRSDVAQLAQVLGEPPA